MKWSSLIIGATACTVSAAAAFTTAMVAINVGFIDGIIEACRDKRRFG